MAERESGDTLALEARAPAKVNLRLRVFDRDESGYHPLETLFLRLELADDVRLIPGGEEVRLSVECREGIPPASVPTGEENLCLRAARMVVAELGDRDRDPPGGFEIRLGKRIPVGAGLGGGSADAGAVLRLVNRLAGEPLSLPELVRIAARLGSDVPFAVLPAPAALGWGRGDRLLPLSPPPPRPALVAFVGEGVSTPEAYRWLDEDRRTGTTGARAAGTTGARAAGTGRTGGGPAEGGEGAVLPPPDRLGSWDVLAGLAVNDFEGPVFRRRPELRSLREALSADATLARLSGSGQAVFAVYPEESARDRAAERAVGLTGVTVRRTRTVGG